MLLRLFPTFFPGFHSMFSSTPKIKEEDVKTEVKEEPLDEEEKKNEKEEEGMKTEEGSSSSTLDPVTGLLVEKIKEEVKEEPDVKTEQQKALEGGIKTRTKTGSLVPKQFANDDLRRRLPVGDNGKEDTKKNGDDSSMQQMTRSKLAQLQSSG